ncbi:MAG: GspMb/PilO family protein [Vicinamibacterales bacterium]
MTHSRAALVRRVLAEHRTWVWPLGLLFVANLLVLGLAVVPMSRSVQAAEARARAASAEASDAAAALKAVTATRDGRDAAARELQVFYRDVLPANVSAARRLLQLRLAQLARNHSVTFARAIATPESIRGSTLARLRVQAELVGRYADVRAFLYALETADEFVIVDSIVLAEGDESSAPLNLTLNVSTYYQAGGDVR